MKLNFSFEFTATFNLIVNKYFHLCTLHVLLLVPMFGVNDVKFIMSTMFKMRLKYLNFLQLQQNNDVAQAIPPYIADQTQKG